MAKVRDRKLRSTYGDRILDAGYYTIPNLLLDKQVELGISNAELVFYIKVTHFYRVDYLKDEQLKMPVNNRTLRRVRKSLAEKGFLRYDVKRFRDRDGKVETVRIKYDWSGLIEALRKLPCGKNVRLDESHADNMSAWYNEDHADNMSAPSLYGKESNVKESSKQTAALKFALQKKGLKTEVADELIERFDAGWIREKIEALERLGDRIKSPAGWLRKAIEANDGNLAEPSNEDGKKAGKARYDAIREAVRKGEKVVIKEDYPVENF